MTVSRINDRSDRQEASAKDRKGSTITTSSSRRCRRTSGSNAVDDGVKRYHGDGLIVRMDTNYRILEIIGDGCRVTLSRNSGSVHVVGDGCWLGVNHNTGNIEYIGDGGRVLLGPDSCKDKKVNFVGDGGKVIYNAAPETIEYREARGRKSRRESSKSRCNVETGHVRRTACSCKEIIERALLECEKCGGQYGDVDTTSSRHRECLDNLLNDVRERSQGKYDERKRDEETRRCSRRQTVTTMKIITKIQSDGRCTRKRFGERSSIQ